MREIASLTKIMTCYVVLKLLDHFQLKKEHAHVRVSKYAAKTIGTSANLKTGD